MKNKEKDIRTKLYQENKKQYKKEREKFLCGVSQNFRQRRENQRKEIELLEDETREVYEEELSDEHKVTGKKVCNNKDCSKLDYSRIKEAFKDMNVKFPLEEEECIGLSPEERLEITPCGTYCGDCEDYGVVCDGCRNRSGRPIWYDLYAKQEPCEHYTCATKKQYHNCSQCHQMPCDKFFEYPDPNMPDEIKQFWFQLRMENFNQMNGCHVIEIANTFKENEKKYKK